jgi:CBS domain-containing protein
MRGITLFIFGGVAEIEEEPKTPKAEFVIGIVGPLSSFLIAIVFYIAHIFSVKLNLNAGISVFFELIFTINITLAVFNLIPAFPLDGGRVLRSILWGIKKNMIWATRISSRIGMLFGWFLILTGIFQIFNMRVFNGGWMILIGFFVKNAAENSYNQLVYKTFLEKQKVEKFISAPLYVTPGITLADFVENYIYKHFLRMFPVIEDGKLIGCADISGIYKINKSEWESKTVKDIIQSCSAANTIDPDSSVYRAFLQMTGTGNTRLMVLENSELKGMISLKDIMKFTKLKKEIERLEE